MGILNQTQPRREKTQKIDNCFNTSQKRYFPFLVSWENNNNSITAKGDILQMIPPQHATGEGTFVI